MTRKDYKVLAVALGRGLRLSRDLDQRAGALLVRNEVIDALAQAYPNFNRTRFLTAIEVEESS